MGVLVSGVMYPAESVRDCNEHKELVLKIIAELRMYVECPELIAR